MKKGSMPMDKKDMPKSKDMPMKGKKKSSRGY